MKRSPGGGTRRSVVADEPCDRRQIDIARRELCELALEVSPQGALFSQSFQQLGCLWAPVTPLPFGTAVLAAPPAALGAAAQRTRPLVPGRGVASLELSP
eukprot:Amastigsp_a176775_4.p3 type:complete len:100 gc:universal Amastigsp_a176775_4:379-80(-)